MSLPDHVLYGLTDQENIRADITNCVIMFGLEDVMQNTYFGYGGKCCHGHRKCLKKNLHGLQKH